MVDFRYREREISQEDILYIRELIDKDQMLRALLDDLTATH